MIRVMKASVQSLSHLGRWRTCFTWTLPQRTSSSLRHAPTSYMYSTWVEENGGGGGGGSCCNWLECPDKYRNRTSCTPKFYTCIIYLLPPARKRAGVMDSYDVRMHVCVCVCVCLCVRACVRVMNMVLSLIRYICI